MTPIWDGNDLLSWYHPGLEVRESRISGFGVFSKQSIPDGQPLMIWGGRFFTLEAVRAGEAAPNSLAGYSEGIYLGQSIGDSKFYLDHFINHSCRPNSWLGDVNVLISRGAISPDEEVVSDYALWEIDNDWILPVECACGVAECRVLVTGRDWMIPELQRSYRGHFLPCLEERIKNLPKDRRNNECGKCAVG